MTIEVSEIYVAPQGEGPNLGRLSLFLRLHRCNLSCSWCDSRFTWDKNDPGFDDYHLYTAEELVAVMLAVAEENGRPRGLVITGGEPLIWQRFLPPVVDEYGTAMAELNLTPVYVEVETAGTIMPSQDMLERCHFNVSHKLASSGNEKTPISRLWNEEAARSFLLNDSIFKPVVSASDSDESVGLYLSWLIAVGYKCGATKSAVQARVYLMPEGQRRDAVLLSQRRTLELAQKYGVNCTTRMHILAYGDERRR